MGSMEPMTASYKIPMCAPSVLKLFSALHLQTRTRVLPHPRFTLYLIYSDYVDVNQTFVFPHVAIGAELQVPFLVGGNSPSTLGTEYIQDFLGYGPNWPWQDFDYSYVVQADAVNPGNATADDFDMSPFQAKGGKLIMYHGLADGLIATGSSPYFYNHVVRTMAPMGIDTDSWYRFFLVPGMQHCATSVGDAPWYYAGGGQAGALGTNVYSVPGFEDADHDVLMALMKWVEEGVAPDMIIATKYKNDTVSEGVARQRPLCMYPKIGAKYLGGDVNATASWTCD